MKEYERATINKPETKPAHDEVAKNAYGTYLKEGRSQGRDAQNRLEAESKTPPRFPWLSTSDSMQNVLHTIFIGKSAKPGKVAK
jgi:hypothetical protein